MIKSKKDILRERAQQIAQPVKTKSQDKSLEVVIFYLNEERYAIESEYVREVFALKEVTCIPGTPPIIYGIINVRRRIISLVNLKVLLQLSSPEQVLDKAIILEGEDQEFAIIIDKLEETISIPTDSIQPPIPTLTGSKQEFLKGITLNQLSILDGEKLLKNKQLIIRENAV